MGTLYRLIIVALSFCLRLFVAWVRFAFWVDWYLHYKLIFRNCLFSPRGCSSESVLAPQLHQPFIYVHILMLWLLSWWCGMFVRMMMLVRPEWCFDSNTCSHFQFEVYEDNDDDNDDDNDVEVNVKDGVIGQTWSEWCWYIVILYVIGSDLNGVERSDGRVSSWVSSGSRAVVWLLHLLLMFIVMMMKLNFNQLLEGMLHSIFTSYPIPLSHPKNQN